MFYLLYFAFYAIQLLGILLGILLVKVCFKVCGATVSYLSLSRQFALCLIISLLIIFIAPLLFMVPRFTSQDIVIALGIVLIIFSLSVSSFSIKKVGLTKSLMQAVAFVVITIGIWGATLYVLKTFLIQDWLLVSKEHLTYTKGTYGMLAKYDLQLQRGDIVFHAHEWASNLFVISRVIGLPGENLTITNAGSVLINDVALDEPYAIGETKIYPWNEPVSYTIPENRYYLMSDSRESPKKDSRHLGPYAPEKIQGVFYPAPPFAQNIVTFLTQNEESQKRYPTPYSALNTTNEKEIIKEFGDR